MNQPSHRHARQPRRTGLSARHDRDDGDRGDYRRPAAARAPRWDGAGSIRGPVAAWLRDRQCECARTSVRRFNSATTHGPPVLPLRPVSNLASTFQEPPWRGGALSARCRALLTPAEMLVIGRKRGSRSAAGSGGMEQPDRPSEGGVRLPRFCGRRCLVPPEQRSSFLKSNSEDGTAACRRSGEPAAGFRPIARGGGCLGKRLSQDRPKLFGFPGPTPRCRAGGNGLGNLCSLTRRAAMSLNQRRLCWLLRFALGRRWTYGAVLGAAPWSPSTLAACRRR